MNAPVHRTEVVSAERAEAYRGTFATTDPPLEPGDALRPAWESLAFPFAAPFAELRPDGTPARDGVIPEVDLPRRMYAGERTDFLRPIAVGDEVVQTASLGEVAEKTGAGGRMVFVDVVREYRVGGKLAVRSVWHDVFLPAADRGQPARGPRRDGDAAEAADWVEPVTLDIRQLFRFSALTFNTHRIHYDRGWARELEGLPDLVVHGPLTRVLLMDAARRRTGRQPAMLTVRMSAPAFVDRRIRFAGTTEGDATRVMALDDADVVLATADIDWR